VPESAEIVFLVPSRSPFVKRSPVLPGERRPPPGPGKLDLVNPHATTRPPASSDELERARISRRLEEFVRGGRRRRVTLPDSVSPAASADRGILIGELRQAGWTYVAIARVVGVSRQRVAQIDRAREDRRRA